MAMTTVQFTVDAATGVTDAWVHDDGGNFDAANSRYVCRDAGYYEFTCQLAHWDAFIEEWQGRIEYSPDNGANWHVVAIRRALDRDYINGLHMGFTGLFAAGDWLRVRVWQGNAGAQNLNGPADPGLANTFFSGAMLYRTGAGGSGLPKRDVMWHDECTVTAGVALAYQIPGAAGAYQTTSVQNPAALNDSFTHGCFLRAGTYTFYVLGFTVNVNGKIDWAIDGNVIVAGQDWYSVGPVYNVVKSTAAVVVATDGWHVIRGTCSGKNGASGGFRLYFIKYWFKQAAD